MTSTLNTPGGAFEHAALWTGSAASFVDLRPADPGDKAWSRANGVGGGQQVGMFCSTLVPVSHACLWSGSAASFVDLHPAGWQSSEALGVAGGQQVGWVASGGGVYHACLWSGSAASFVDLHPAGWDMSDALGVGDGQQVGRVFGPHHYHAGLWSGSAASFVDLHPAGWDESTARGAAGGHQVGNVWGTNGQHACLWSGSAASFVDLHGFLDPRYQWATSEAYGVDVDAGGGIWVVGQALQVGVTTNRLVAVAWHYPPDAPAPPTTTMSITPPPNSNGWRNGPVQVAIYADQPNGSITGIYYQLDGGNTQVYAGPFSVTGDTPSSQPHVVTAWCEGTGGTSPTVQQLVFIDAWSGTIWVTAQARRAGSSGSTAHVTISGKITDGGSGLDRSTPTYSITDKSGQVIGSGSVALSPTSGDGEVRFDFSTDVDLTPPKDASIMIQARDKAGHVMIQVTEPGIWSRAWFKLEPSPTNGVRG